MDFFCFFNKNEGSFPFNRLHQRGSHTNVVYFRLRVKYGMITFRGRETVAISFGVSLGWDPQELFMTTSFLFCVEEAFKETRGLWDDTRESSCDTIISVSLNL
jgi:hypothetical protein